MKKNFSPIVQAERITLLDTLRGFAVFGILIVNMPLFFLPFSMMMQGAKPDTTFVHIFSESFIKFFFEGKFYVMFSLLFGYGFWIFINKATSEGSSIIHVFARRAFFLFLFGVAHVVLLWAGDILVFYGLLGLLLILFRKVSDRGLVKWSIGLGLIPSLITGFMVLVFTLFYQIPQAREGMEAGIQQSIDSISDLVERASLAYSQGSFSEIVAIRIEEYKAILPGVLFFYPMVLAMFLLGAWAARKKLIANYMEHLPFFRKVFWWGLGIGLIANAVYAFSFQHAQMVNPDIWSFLSTFGHSLGGFTFCLLYVSVVVLLVSMGKLRTFTKWLSPVGRMALTNYLMHSLICTFIFLPYGFGLFGKIEIWHGIILTIIIYGLQIPFSNWWLKHFHFGPFEWLWRSLTYLKLQPFIK
jgi:uncharacterized protein